MITFFRRALKSKVVIGILALIAIAIVVTGVGTPAGMGLSGTTADGETIATMDGAKIGSVEATRRVRDAFAQAQQQQPGLDMAGFVRGGGVEATLRRIVSARAVEIWGRDHGFTASKKLVDGEIASIPAFQGPTGRFDENTFRGILARERLTEAQLRDDIAGDAIRRQILGPIAGGTRAADALARPYAEMLLERREGMIGFVPAAAMTTIAAPTAAEINAFYTANAARFTIPERRVIRYALIGAGQVPAPAAPTEAELQAAYTADAAKYAARTSRTLSQVVLPDEAAARAFAARVRGGTSFAAAAQAAGFSPTDTALGAKTQAEVADLASPAVAAAAFAAADGAITDPARSPLGWHVVHVDRIVQTAATPLAAVRGVLTAAIAKRKADDALAGLVAKIEDSISDGATFEQAAVANKLQVVTTPAILPTGAAPGVAGWSPPAVLAPLVKAAFQAGEDDDPSIETLAPGAYALLDVADVVAPAAIPLAQVRPAVIAELEARRRYDAARRVADGIVAKASRGTPLAAAIAQAGVRLPAPQPAGGRQIELAQTQARTGGQIPPALTALFAIAPGKVRLVPAPDRSGWFVVKLDRVVPGDLKTMPQLLGSTREEFGRIFGGEYADQFIAAVMKDVGVKQDAGAIARLKAALLSGGAAQ